MFDSGRMYMKIVHCPILSVCGPTAWSGARLIFTVRRFCFGNVIFSPANFSSRIDCALISSDLTILIGSIQFFESVYIFFGTIPGHPSDRGVLGSQDPPPSGEKLYLFLAGQPTCGVFLFFCHIQRECSGKLMIFQLYCPTAFERKQLSDSFLCMLEIQINRFYPNIAWSDFPKSLCCQNAHSCKRLSMNAPPSGEEWLPV